MRKIYVAIMMMAVACVSAMAQKVADKELVGVWILESMRYDGESVIPLGKNDTQIKYYGADGEYACAQVALTKDGKVQFTPHEYGKYSMKNGVYSEMGREPVPRENMVLDSPTQFHGRWKNRNDVWRKCTNMPKSLVDYIVGKCKAAQPNPEVDEQLKKFCFK